MTRKPLQINFIEHYQQLGTSFGFYVTIRLVSDGHTSGVDGSLPEHVLFHPLLSFSSAPTVNTGNEVLRDSRQDFPAGRSNFTHNVYLDLLF